MDFDEGVSEILVFHQYLYDRNDYYIFKRLKSLFLKVILPLAKQLFTSTKKIVTSYIIVFESHLTSGKTAVYIILTKWPFQMAFMLNRSEM